jgi:hypothetical protein
MPDEKKHEGIATKILNRAKNPSQEKEKTIHESLPRHISDKVHERYENYKVERREREEHRKELQKTQHEAYQKEEIKQAAESGKKAAQKRYVPKDQHTQSHPSHVAKQSANFAKGASSGFGSGLFGKGNSGYYDMSFGGVGVASKKKPAPERVTTVNPRTGKVTIREPIVEEKKKPLREGWNSLDMLTVPEFHTAHSTNPFNIEVSKPHTTRKGKGKRKAPKRKWQLGDIY